MTLDDLRNLDPKDFSNWPLPAKLGVIAIVCVLIVFLGYWFIIKGELEEYAELQTKEAGLKDTFLNKKALAINLVAYKAQMEEMRQTFGAMLRQLPGTNEVPDLLIDITQAGLGRGLEFILFKPEHEKRIDFYAELPISLKVSGTYHELAQFISDLSALPRIVTLGDIAITPTGKDNQLVMTATAKTYRYIETEPSPFKGAK
jgi:type IV pilus assembly protein PilO